MRHGLVRGSIVVLSLGVLSYYYLSEYVWQSTTTTTTTIVLPAATAPTKALEPLDTQYEPQGKLAPLTGVTP